MRPRSRHKPALVERTEDSSKRTDSVDTSIDRDISGWILEFLLRQNIDNSVLKDLLSILPVSNQDAVLKKGILLRGLQGEISSGLISEKVLEYMELLAMLGFADGAEVPEFLADAYYAVVVRCATNCSGMAKDHSGKFMDAVERIMKDRINHLWNSGICDPISKKMRNWLYDIETAILDNTVCELVFSTAATMDALALVNVYLTESWKNMGPSVLEVAASHVSETRDSKREERRNKSDQMQHAGDLIRSGAGDDKFSETLAKKLTNQEQRCLTSVEVNKIRAELRSSSLDLREVVKDPLPEALHFSESVANKIGQSNTDKSGNECPRSQKGAPQPGLMARNHTARTYEWDDSASRPSLPSPKTIKISPLKGTKFVLRRKKKKWSTQEEEALLNAVREHGRGNWKLILDEHRDVFEERTEVDLKDKWRNMVK